MGYFVLPPKTTAVQGIPIGKLNDLQNQINKLNPSSGSGFQVPTSGAVNGTNNSFTWATAPNVLVVDNGRAMRSTSADGTVNWTGTTTTVLTIAPNNDIFATA